MKKVGSGNAGAPTPVVSREPAAPPAAASVPLVAPAAARPAPPDKFAGATDSKRLDLLGIDAADPTGPLGIGRSKILDVLENRLAPMQAVQVPNGKVVWFNHELARRMGLPSGGQMTPELHDAVVKALAYRALKPGEDPAGRPTVTLYADMYGGTGTGMKGAGRAAFYPWGNLNVKGIGLTPLAIVDPNDFQHSHGGAPMVEGMLEAVWGEVNGNLFTHGSTQILAVIDLGDFTEWPDGGREHRALIVRAGQQYRPAHLLEDMGGHALSPDIFLKAAKETGVLVSDPKTGQPDLKATLLKLIDNHARTSAEQIRWRILHGAISTSNMELDGTQLDLSVETSQPRTAPIQVLPDCDPGEGTFGIEHIERARELTTIYDELRKVLGPEKAAALNAQPVDLYAAMDAAYRRHLEVALTRAAGLKGSLAEELQRAAPKQVAQLTETLQALMALKNDGDVSADKRVVEDVGVVDVFNALRFLPRAYFKDPKADHTDEIKRLLAPIVRGPQAAAVNEQVDRLALELGKRYAAVMEAARPLAEKHYDTAMSFPAAVAHRAAFENEPIEKLYRSRMTATARQAIGDYERTGDLGVFKEAVDKVIAGSVRNAEALLKQGGTRKLANGGLELEARTIDGIDYSVRAWPNRRRRVSVTIPVEGNDAAGYVLSSLPGKPKLSRAQLDQLRFRYTTDGWKSRYREAPVRLTQDEQGRTVLTFGRPGDAHAGLPVAPNEIGRLEGAFYTAAEGGFWLKDGSTNFRGYTFAVPDAKEFADLALGS